MYKNPDQRGHLYVVLEIDMPDEQWLKTVDGQVRIIFTHAFHLG